MESQEEASYIDEPDPEFLFFFFFNAGFIKAALIRSKNYIFMYTILWILTNAHGYTAIRPIKR